MRGIDNRGRRQQLAAQAAAARGRALHQPGGGRHQLRACSSLASRCTPTISLKPRARINARLARAGEALTLLDGRMPSLRPATLVSRRRQRRAVGSRASWVAPRTAGQRRRRTDVFLEVGLLCAAARCSGAARYGLHTDASQRFERGVSIRQARCVTCRALLLAHRKRVAGGPARITAVDPLAAPAGATRVRPRRRAA